MTISKHTKQQLMALPLDMISSWVAELGIHSDYVKAMSKEQIADIIIYINSHMRWH